VQTLKLALGAATQSVEVSEAAPTVQTTSTDVSTTITKTQIQDLPVMDRSRWVSCSRRPASTTRAAAPP